ncbi:MAG: transposase [archaeon]|nr:transposase [archaeon]
MEGYKADIKVIRGREKEEMFIWLTNVFDASPEQIIEDYGNRWLIETLFEEAKGEWYINKLPSRDLEPIKVHFYFNFIAYDLVSIFKRTLTEKYRNAGIEVLRRDILHKIAVISFTGKSIKFEFNRKYEIRYNEQLASVNEFITRTRDKIELVKFDALA